MSIRRIAIMLGAATALAACASPTPYKAAVESDGFSERLIEDGRYLVSFKGNSRTKRDTVETYLLHRAAEVTLAADGDWFLVVTRELDPNEQVIVHGDPFFRPFAFGGGVFPYGRRKLRSAIFYNPFPPTVSTIRRYEATAEIVVRKGEKPPDEPLAYDARQVIENLGPQIIPPEAEE